jgi:acyl carrier protein
MPDGLKDQIRDIITTTLALDESELSDDLSQKDCARWTSLNHMLLMVALEEHFGVTLSLNEMVSMVSLPLILEVLGAHAAARAAA